MTNRDRALSRRTAPAALVTALIAGALVVAPASPASAAPVTTFGELQTALDAGGTVVLGADIAAPTSTLSITQTGTFDLAGFALTTDSATVASGTSVTVIDSLGGGSWLAESTTDADPGIRTTGATFIVDGATVTGDGGNLAAGIGGGDGESGGTLIVRSGDVTARNSGIFFGGVGYAAGIGGGRDGGGGTVEITGGTVHATGGSAGAGIGGTTNPALDGGTTTITGGTVTAIGGGTGAGIGGGLLQDGGTITIGGTAAVTVKTGFYAAGIGGGRGGAGGDITINGGTVTVTTAVADDTGAAIGGGERGAGGTITINGGTIIADATRVGTNRTGSAGIGSGDATENNSGQSGIVTGPTGAGGTITINGGTVTARGSGGAAGIGGGEHVDGWIIEINGGTVNAYGGAEAAGIGGGNRGDGGQISINGGTVNAYGGLNAAGIGGGDGEVSGGGGGTISITSDVSEPIVVARSGTYGAGIGGGELGGSSTITIGDGTTVSADGGLFGPAIGRGINGDASTWTVAGTLILPTSDTFVTVYTGDTVTIGATGVIEGDGSVGVAAGGSILNNGIIRTASVGPQSFILDHSYRFEFDGNFAGSAPIDAVEVFAPTFESGDRALPTATRPGFFLGGWNTASDGGGATVTSTSTIAAGGTLYAQWTEEALAVVPETDTVTAGSDIEFLIQDRADGNLDVTAVSTVTTDETSDVITTKADGLIAFTRAGERVITATLDADSSKTGTVAITVVADTANPTALEATPSATRVNEGGTIAFDFAFLDPYGNPFPVDGEVVLTSDVSTDIISGNQVTFPTASVHTITARFDGFETTVTITVVPASDLADTGVDLAVPLGLAGGLLGLGAILLLRRRLA